MTLDGIVSDPSLLIQFVERNGLRIQHLARNIDHSNSQPQVCSFMDVFARNKQLPALIRPADTGLGFRI